MGPYPRQSWLVPSKLHFENIQQNVTLRHQSRHKIYRSIFVAVNITFLTFVGMVPEPKIKNAKGEATHEANVRKSKNDL